MLIAIEGCIGAGKSTVARGLSEYRKSNLLLERFEEHPFLKLFYENPSETATETEIAFLLLHYSQLRSLNCPRQKETVTDFHLGKDLLYADLNLTDTRAKAAFLNLYEVFSEKVPPPTMLVYLSARTDLILKRIHQRNRDFEAVVDPAYYSRVNEAYDNLFLMYSGKKLSIPMEEWDFITRPSLYQELSVLIDSQLTSGK
jgi:deoxyadenosine/deoxycytidine kinase